MWSEEYCIGHESIDEQHRHLFELANYTKEHNKELSRHDIKLVIAAVMMYMREHFHAEENYLREQKHPCYITHYIAHKNLAQAFLELVQNISSFDDCQEKIHVFLQEYLIAHILKEDMSLRQGVDSNVLASTQSAPLAKQRFRYTCQCPDKKHFITQQAHEKITALKAQFRCKACKQFIIFEGIC